MSKILCAIWIFGGSLFALGALVDAAAGKPWLLSAAAALAYFGSGFCFYMAGRTA